MSVVKRKNLIRILNIVGWLLILGLTFFWSAHTNTESINTVGISLFLLDVITLLFIYFVNSLFLIPRYLFSGKRHIFLGLNTLLILILVVKSFYINDFAIINMLGLDMKRPRPRGLTFIARETINYILMIGFVTALKLMGRLELSEEALREADNARVKAELANLRSQLNPHFLLNTLNNIYALTAIDPERAQKTIKELSILLRYVLYDNLTDRVLLTKEVEFLKNYIELMRIRLSSQVCLDVRYNIESDSVTEIAPLIFISLVENAFKHGVSAEVPSFIDIVIDDRRAKGEVFISIRNSNNAKSDSDKSGRGVGLDQVYRRLELLYKGAYEWSVVDEDGVYESSLTLKWRV